MPELFKAFEPYPFCCEFEQGRVSLSLLYGETHTHVWGGTAQTKK